MSDRVEYFESRIERITETGCWIWMEGTTRHGYGLSSRTVGRSSSAYRSAYEAFIGPIPAGLSLDHLCRVSACVNPHHLEPVTHAENVRRGISFSAVNGKKTHCMHGHEFIENNIYTRPGKKSRDCRACRARRKIEESARRRKPK